MFYVRSLKLKKYLKHFAAYEISTNTSNENIKYKMLPISKFDGPPVNAHKTALGLQLIQPKQYL